MSSHAASTSSSNPTPTSSSISASTSSSSPASTALDCVSANSMSFAKVCELLECVDKLTSTTGKTNVRQNCQEQMGRLFTRWREVALTNKDPDDNAFHLLRLLVPHLDRERPPYNVKEQKLSRLLIDLLTISKTSPDADALLNFKAPKGGAGANKGDFASVVNQVLHRRGTCQPITDMTVAKVNLQLDAFAKSQQEGVRGKATSEAEFNAFLQKLSARDMKWLIRIILKDLKIKMGQGSILNAFHKDADDFFNLNSDLRKLCATLVNPSIRLHEKEIQLFTPFKPMLADRSDSIDDVMKKMSNGEFFLETKLDGERIQIHRDGVDYKYFTRNYHDASDSFGKTAHDGSLSRHIHSAFKSSVRSVILDGEMIGYEPSAGLRVSKAENLDVRSLKDGADGPQPCFYVFDLLYLNGQVLTGKPLRERLQKLKEVFDPIEGRIMHVPRLAGREKEAVADFFNNAVDAREEGIIVKAVNSHYQANSRKGGWLKLKPDYVGSTAEFDLVIVGGYYGTGRRAGVSLVTHFLLALRHDVGNGKCEYHTVSRVGSGYNFLELQELNNTLKKSFVQNTGDHSRPKNVLTSSKGKGKPDVWVKPENSVVVQIKAAELTKSDVFHVGHTLRFPRLQYFRNDKNVEDAMTTSEFAALLQQDKGKIITGDLPSTSSSSSTSPKRRKKDPLVTSPAKRFLADQFASADLTKIETIADVFDGKEIVVLNDPPGFPAVASGLSLLKKTTTTKNASTDDVKPFHMSRADLQIRLTELGAIVSQNPTSKTFCVASFRPDDMRTKNYVKLKKHLVVRGDWLCQCVAAKRLLPLSPLDCLYADEKVRKDFEGEFDRFGDSFEDDVDEDKLRLILDNVTPIADGECPDEDDVKELRDRVLQDTTFSIFIGHNVYLDTMETIGDITTEMKSSSLEITAVDVSRFGGRVTKTLDETVTHVICDDVERAEGFRNLRRTREKKFQLVTSEWVDKSIEAGRLREERLFEPH